LGVIIFFKNFYNKPLIFFFFVVTLGSAVVI